MLERLSQSLAGTRFGARLAAAAAPDSAWDAALARAAQAVHRAVPADSEAAVAHLEQLRTRGVDHLIVPAAASWWLEHYRGLREHLEHHYHLVSTTADCAVWKLTGAPA
jgi:hypothetical protein